MSLLNTLMASRRPPINAAPRPARPGTPQSQSQSQSQDDAAGCGWFDSSHALQCGLRVTEHASADAVAGDLPLSDWLELHLAGWPGLAAAAAAEAAGGRCAV